MNKGKLLTGIAVILGGAVASVVVWVWAVFQLWNWFLVPLGAPSIDIWHTAGILAFLTVVNTGLAGTEKREDASSDKGLSYWAAPWVGRIVGYLLILAFGYWVRYMGG